MGSASDEAGEPWKSNRFYGGAAPYRDDPAGTAADAPEFLTRQVSSGAPVLKSDDEKMLTKSLYPDFRLPMETSHDSAHGYIGGTLNNAHTSFRDPFVFLLHSNVDRLFALWQLREDVDTRLDANQVYGAEGNTVGSGDVETRRPTWGILSPVEPWAGPAAQNATTGVIDNIRLTRPWAPPENLQNDPKNIKDHKHWTIVKPPCYDTNPTVVEALNPGSIILFNQIPTGETTIRAARFRFVSCLPLTFTVTSGPNTPFNVFTAGGTFTKSQRHDEIWTEGLMWFSFTGGPPGTSTSSSVTIRSQSDDFSQDFTFNLSGNSIARPTAAIVMALDQSGSMNEPAGSTGQRRIDALRFAAKTFIDVIQPGNAVGLIRFDDPAYGVNDPTYPGLAVTAVGEGILDPGRSLARDAVFAHTTNPNGWTAIGSGIIEARNVVSAASRYDVRAVVVFTDGLQNRGPSIESVIDDSDTRIYAVGLGKADQINSTELSKITRGTNGFTNITGDLSSSTEDFYKLTKYFLQILAGVTNTAIVQDPAGFLPLGTQVKIPFKIAEVDIESTVVLLTDLPAVYFVLETPKGNVITPANATASGARFYDASTNQYYRFNLPVTTGSDQESTGTWYAILRVDRERFKRHCHGKLNQDVTHPETSASSPVGQATIFGEDTALTPCKRGGIRYNLSMYAWSNLHMKADIYQDSQRPGAAMTARALLDEYGIAFGGSATIIAHITKPDGTNIKLTLIQVEQGIYEAQMKAALPGLYEFRIVASGSTSKGFGFTREQILTACTVVGSDPPQPGQGGSTGGCCLVKSVLKDPSVGTFLKKHDIDAGTLVKSVEECCSMFARGTKPR